MNSFELMKKLLFCGVLSLISTFVFYTFAIPFYPNFTFLLPLDCLINNLSIFLLFQFNDSIYRTLCFCCNKAADRVKLFLHFQKFFFSFFFFHRVCVCVVLVRFFLYDMDFKKTKAKHANETSKQTKFFFFC